MAKEENAVLALDVEAIDRLDQAQRSHLVEVVKRLAAAGIAPREVAREREEPLDQLLTRHPVARTAPNQQSAVLPVSVCPVLVGSFRRDTAHPGAGAYGSLEQGLRRRHGCVTSVHDVLRQPALSGYGSLTASPPVTVFQLPF